MDVRTVLKIEDESDTFGTALNRYVSYSEIYSEFGEVLLVVSDDDWQGDSLILLKKDDKFGFLSFGWGSCSGCDALEHANSVKEIQELSDQLEQSIRWFDSKESAAQFMRDHDWEGDYSYNSDELKTFPGKALAILEVEVQ